MTISEAAQLVLQSSAISSGGETFILNMGNRVKILDLAKKMISNRGLEIKDSKNLNGDIEIKLIGIQKGEKIKEELIHENGEIKKTINPLINIAYEDFKIDDQISKEIYKLIVLLKENKDTEGKKIFKKILDVYNMAN